MSNGDNIYAHLGTGFTLLAFDADAELVAAFKATAQKLNIPLKCLADTYSADRLKYESNLILVRPDQFVAWCSDATNCHVENIMRKVVNHVY